MKTLSCDVVVIGGGPGGYVCAIRAGQAGLRTVLVEKSSLGGTCLNVGCIPSKALIHAAHQFDTVAHLAAENALGITTAPPEIDLRKTMRWKDGIVSRLGKGVGALLARAGVRVISGTARFDDARTVVVDSAEGEITISTRNAVIATGSEPIALPSLPLGGAVLDSTAALSLAAVPHSLAVVGGGVIGLEIGQAWAKLGARVSVFEAGPRLLPQFDVELTAPLLKRLKQAGVQVHLAARVGAYADGVLAYETPSGPQQCHAEKVLVAVGRRPSLAGLGLNRLLLSVDAAGFLAVDETCQTAMRGLYAIGDVTPGPMLAHRATAQGMLVAEVLAGRRKVWDVRAIPAICYTDPEIVSVGLVPEDAPELVTGTFALAANGRALAGDDGTGFVRVVARRADHAVVGVQAVGRDVSELSSAFVMAIEMGARLEDLQALVLAHPSRSEAFAESAMNALGQGLHS